MGYCRHLPVSPFTADLRYRTYRHWEARADRLRFHYDLWRQKNDADTLPPLYAEFLTDYESAIAALDSYSVKYETIKKMASLLRSRGNIADDCERVFDFYIPRKRSRSLTAAELIYYRRHREKSLAARQGEMLYRLLVESEYRIKAGWFCVFDTLTLSRDYYSEVMSKGSRAYTDYIRRVRYACGGKDNHSSFGVVQEGDKTGRLHIHVIHFCRRLPAGCADPNAGRVIPDERVIVRWRRFWQFGTSEPVAVRLSQHSDAYSRLGWRWPVEILGEKAYPILAGDASRVAGYVARYVGRNYQCRWRCFQWRTRMTRGFGLQQLRAILPPLRMRELMLISSLNRFPKVNQGAYRAIPLNLIRRESARLILSRMRKNPRRMWRWLMELRCRPSLPTKWRNMIIVNQRYKSAKIGRCPTPPTLPSLAGFDVAFQKIRAGVSGELRQIQHGGSPYAVCY